MDRHQEGTPPAILTAEDILAQMREGVKQVHEISLRGYTFPVRVLSIDEVNAIRREAIRVAAMGGGDTVDKNVETQKATLRLASTVTQGGPPMLGDKVLSMLSVDEVNYLYEEFVRVMDSVNPSLESIPPEQFRELVDALKKSTISPKDCSLRQLRAICTAYVDLILRLETRDSQPAS